MLKCVLIVHLNTVSPPFLKYIPMNTPKSSLTLLILLSLLAVHSQAEEKHAAHSHGLGTLEIAIDGKKVKGTFEIPMESLLGHEYLPRSATEKKAMADLQSAASKASYFVIFPAAAECKEKSLSAESAMFAGKQSEHSDLDVDFEFECAKPQALNQIEFPLFAKHPRLGSLKVDLAGPKGQKSLTVKAKDPVLRW